MAHWMKDRLGFLLVIAMAAIGTALVSGNYLVAVGSVMLVGLGIVALWRSPSEQELVSDSPTERRSPGEEFRWSFRAANSRPRSEQIQALQGLGLRLDADDGHYALLEGGSQLRTRLLGGYFVNPSHLPIAVAVSESDHPDGPLLIQVRDRLGRIAVRDRALESRYAARAKELQQALGHGCHGS